MVIAIFLLAGSATTVDPRCATRIALVGACREVHGRLQASNGNPGVRIWVIGTKRVLGVGGQEGSELLPPLLRTRVSFETVIYGDFRVCPVTPDRPGEMQMVCVDAGRRLIQETIETGRLHRLPDVAQE